MRKINSVKSIQSHRLPLLVALLLITLFLISKLVQFSPEQILRLLFLEGLLVMFIVWLILGKIVVDKKEKLIAFFKQKKPGCKPFEYLFFVFLFGATYYLTFLAAFLVKPEQIISNFLRTFLLSFFFVFFVTALAFGWFHYIKEIHG